MTKTFLLPTIAPPVQQTGIGPTKAQVSLPVKHIDVEEPAGLSNKRRAYWQEVFTHKITPEQLTSHALYCHNRAMIALPILAERVAERTGRSASLCAGQDFTDENFWMGLIGTNLQFMLDREFESLSLLVRQQALVEAVESRTTDVELRKSLGNVLLTLRTVDLIVTKGLPMLGL